MSEEKETNGKNEEKLEAERREKEYEILCDTLDKFEPHLCYEVNGSEYFVSYRNKTKYTGHIKEDEIVVKIESYTPFDGWSSKWIVDVTGVRFERGRHTKHEKGIAGSDLVYNWDGRSHRKVVDKFIKNINKKEMNKNDKKKRKRTKTDRLA